jgi:pimeloyl-ACP methyl ester carboxylesterase
VRERNVSVKNGTYDVPVFEAGEGEPVLYLHGIWDQPPNAFIEELARRFRVIAPVHLGFESSASASDMVDILDAIYYHLDLCDALEVSRLPLVGHCLGGMFAAELAAVQPDRFTRLVLISPVGLWDEARPAMDVFAAVPSELAAALYGDPQSAAALEAARAPQNEDELVAHLLRRSKSLATATRYLWPIPDRGLRRRVHRITMPTLVVVGDRDAVCPVSYATEMARLCGGRAEVIAGAGHLVHLESAGAVASLTAEHLAPAAATAPA